MGLLQVQFEDGVEPFDPSPLVAQAEAMIEAAGIQRPVNLLFCSPHTIAEMNGAFRGKPRPTDILSFGYEGPEEPQGDLALCLEVAREQAEAFGLSLDEELARLLAHGLVHLLGFDHQTPAEEEAMLAHEKELLAPLGLGGLYP